MKIHLSKSVRAPKTNKSIIIGHILGFVAVAFWGGSFVSTKMLTDHGLGPVEIYVYRFTLAYIILLISNHKHLKARTWRDEALFVVCGLCGGSIYFIAENNAVLYTRVSDVSMLTTLAPLLTTLLIGLLYKAERPSKWVYIGSVMSFAGVALIVFKDGFSFNNPSAAVGDGAAAHSTIDAAIGDVLAILAAFSWAIYAVVLRKLNVTYDVGFISRKTFFYGLVTALPFWAITPEAISPLSQLMSWSVILNLLYLGVLCSFGAYTLYAISMRNIGAIMANNYLYVQPIVTMVIAAIVFSNDPITALGCCGAMLIIGGIWFGDKMDARKIRKS